MFAERLRKTRLAQNITHKDVADQLKISRVAYTNYENGNRQPNYEILEALAEYFGVTADYLIGRVDEPTNAKKLDIPPELADLPWAFHKGGIDSLTQDEIQKLVEIAKIIKRESNNE